MLYTHSHVLDDGTVITHAHPYDEGSGSSPFPSHHHSNAELLIFSILNFLTFVALAVLFALTVVKAPSFQGFKQYFEHSTCPRAIQGRAPPTS